MAINPSTKYPGQIDTSDSTGYPYGKAQNITVSGDGTGTPWEKDLVNDVFGFQQALLKSVNATPTGTADKVGASQYLDALNTRLGTTGNLLTKRFFLPGSFYSFGSAALSGINSSITGFCLKPDGTKIFFVGTGGGVSKIFEATLGTAFDITTLTYSGVNFSVAGQTATPVGIRFSTDGSKTFIISSGGHVFGYTLSTAWSIATASYASIDKDISGTVSIPRDFTFNAAGTKLYVVDTTAIIKQFSTAGAFDLTTLTYDSVSLNVGSTPSAVCWNDTGSRFYVAFDSTNLLAEYNCGTSYSISGGTKILSPYSFDSQVLSDNVGGFSFSPTGTKFWVCTQSNIYEYYSSAVLVA